MEPGGGSWKDDDRQLPIDTEEAQQEAYGLHTPQRDGGMEAQRLFEGRQNPSCLQQHVRNLFTVVAGGGNWREGKPFSTNVFMNVSVGYFHLDPNMCPSIQFRLFCIAHYHKFPSEGFTVCTHRHP